MSGVIRLLIQIVSSDEEVPVGCRIQRPSVFYAIKPIEARDELHVDMLLERVKHRFRLGSNRLIDDAKDVVFHLGVF